MTQSTSGASPSGNRVVRLGQLAGTTFHVARKSLNRARFVFLAMVCVHLTGGLTFAWLEGATLLDGQYWASVTGATVGYGDLSPATGFGKIFAMSYMWTMTLLWVFVGAHVVAAIIEDKNLFSHREQERNEAFYLVIGKRLGIIPQEATQLPDVEHWVEHHGFKPSED